MPEQASVMLRLPPRADAAAQARRAVHQLCAALPARVRDDAELLTSELVTNSVRHGRGTVTVAIECDGRQLAVAVGDESPDPPRLVEPGADGVGGRGIRIVSRVAAAWGWRPHGDGVGKVVWFRVT